jgi:TolB-like protein/cytochrome c-type biogenesis protein CcmH/NrfG
MTAILRDEPRPIADRRPDLPAAFVRLVSRCLEKRPNDRIQTARDVYNELRALQREASVATPLPALPSSGVASARPKPSSGADATTGLWTTVLPFTARGDDPDLIALAEGLTEDVTAGLIKFPYLKIVAASGSARPPSARYVVQGGMRRAGSMLRVAVDLIDSESGVHLWTERFDREFTASRIFEIQDDLAARMIVNVGDSNGALVRALAASVRDRPMSSLTIDQLIWRGFAAEHRGDPAENGRVIAALETALAPDSAHAEGWAALAQLYGRAHLDPTTGVADAVARQRAAAQRAIGIDPANQRGWSELAAAAFYERDAAAFRSAADRALALNPLNANVAAFLSHLIAYSGDWRRGIDMLERTMARAGQHPGWFYFMPFVNHFRLGEYQQAWEVLKRINMDEYPWTLASLAITAVKLERWDDVRSALTTIRRVAPWFLDPDAATQSLRKLLWDESIVEQEAAALREALEFEVRGTANLRPSSSSAHARAQSIAVLPFANLSADPENEYFGDGLAEGILNALAGVRRDCPGARLRLGRGPCAFRRVDERPERPGPCPLDLREPLSPRAGPLRRVVGRVATGRRPGSAQRDVARDPGRPSGRCRAHRRCDVGCGARPRDRTDILPDPPHARRIALAGGAISRGRRGAQGVAPTRSVVRHHLGLSRARPSAGWRGCGGRSRAGDDGPDAAAHLGTSAIRVGRRFARWRGRRLRADDRGARSVRAGLRDVGRDDTAAQSLAVACARRGNESAGILSLTPVLRSTRG